jgi:hypothetical protein
LLPPNSETCAPIAFPFTHGVQLHSTRASFTRVPNLTNLPKTGKLPCRELVPEPSARGGNKAAYSAANDQLRAVTSSKPHPSPTANGYTHTHTHTTVATGNRLTRTVVSSSPSSARQPGYTLTCASCGRHLYTTLQYISSTGVIITRWSL